MIYELVPFKAKLKCLAFTLQSVFFNILDKAII